MLLLLSISWIIIIIINILSISINEIDKKQIRMIVNLFLITKVNVTKISLKINFIMIWLEWRM